MCVTGSSVVGTGSTGTVNCVVWSEVRPNSPDVSENGGAAPEEAPSGPVGACRTRFTVLGLLTVTDGRDSIPLQPSRPAALLAALLLHANSSVSVELLQRVIWGEDTPLQAKAALHSCVLRLRRLFAKYGVSGNAIEAVPGGYRLTADAETLDLVEFRELLRRAYSAAEPEAELRLLRAALALWQPPLLPNVHSDLLHRDEVPRLREDWLRAIERVFDLELAAGRHREALAEIWPAARAHPLHERFTGQLMEALCRAGRRAEALAEYRRAKEHLADQLGVDPGPALRDLELTILRGEPLPGSPVERDAETAVVAVVAEAAADTTAAPGAETAAADGTEDPARRDTSAPADGVPDPPAGAGPLPAAAPPGDRDPHAGPAPDAGPGAYPAAEPHPAPTGSAGPEPYTAPGANPGAEPHPDPDATPGAVPYPPAAARIAGGGGPPGGAGPGEGGAVPGHRILDRLVRAGLLQEGPRGLYRMHDLLRAFARAAAADGVGGRTTEPSPRPGAVDLHPTEA